jgi:MFS-type transporter involved in bile tolerance (Atg22 family)
MKTTEYLISIAVLFTAIIAPALIVGSIAEYIINRSKNK